MIDNKRTVPLRIVRVFENDGSAPNGIDAEPGDAQYREDGRLTFACPGCAQWGSVSIGSPKPIQGPSWEIISGDPVDPTTLTLAPSIHCVGCCGWHGYLKAGVFVSC